MDMAGNSGGKWVGQGCSIEQTVPLQASGPRGGCARIHHLLTVQAISRGIAMPEQLEHIQQVMREADCLHPRAEVEAAISRVAAQIGEQLRDSNPLVFCVMNGGLIFAGQLLTQLDFPLEQSYLHATRYRNETRGGELCWKARPDVSFAGREVLVIDDILDEGHTLMAIVDSCRQAGARQVYTAVLL